MDLYLSSDTGLVFQKAMENAIGDLLCAFVRSLRPLCPECSCIFCLKFGKFGWGQYFAHSPFTMYCMKCLPSIPFFIPTLYYIFVCIFYLNLQMFCSQIELSVFFKWKGLSRLLVKTGHGYWLLFSSTFSLWFLFFNFSVLHAWLILLTISSLFYSFSRFYTFHSLIALGFLFFSHISPKSMLGMKLWHFHLFWLFGAGRGVSEKFSSLPADVKKFILQGLQSSNGSCSGGGILMSKKRAQVQECSEINQFSQWCRRCSLLRWVRAN